MQFQPYLLWNSSQDEYDFNLVKSVLFAQEQNSVLSTEKAGSKLKASYLTKIFCFEIQAKCQIRINNILLLLHFST